MKPEKETSPRSRKSKKEFVPFSQVLRAVETNDNEHVFAVNMQQYKKLVVLEGQSVILDSGIGWISNVSSRIKKFPRMRKNYVIKEQKKQQSFE